MRDNYHIPTEITADILDQYRQDIGMTLQQAVARVPVREVVAAIRGIEALRFRNHLCSCMEMMALCEAFMWDTLELVFELFDYDPTDAHLVWCVATVFYARSAEGHYVPEWFEDGPVLPFGNQQRLEEDWARANPEAEQQRADNQHAFAIGVLHSRAGEFDFEMAAKFPLYTEGHLHGRREPEPEAPAPAIKLVPYKPT